MNYRYLYVLLRDHCSDPFYVGQADNPYRRFAHEDEALQGKNGCNYDKAHAIRVVYRRLGYVPKQTVRVIGGIRDKAHLDFLEKTVIAALRHSGADLTNIGPGGTGGSHSPEIQAKINAKLKGRPNFKLRGRVKSAEEIEARVAKLKGRPISPQRYKKLLATATAAAIIANTGRSHTAERRAKNSASQKGRVQSPAHNAKISIGMKAYYQRLREWGVFLDSIPNVNAFVCNSTVLVPPLP